MCKIKISEAVIVEGKYDKIKLSSLLDTMIITTDGFSIYKDSDKKELIKKLAINNGIIILTDSDHAGFQIRSYIKNIIGNDNKAKVYDIYIPDIIGKEKRKENPSSEGKLGVEGMDINLLREKINELHLAKNSIHESTLFIDKERLMEDGFYGGKDSSEKRKVLCRKLNLPENLSVKMLINAINNLALEEKYLDFIRSNKN